MFCDMSEFPIQNDSSGSPDSVVPGSAGDAGASLPIEVPPEMMAGAMLHYPATSLRPDPTLPKEPKPDRWAHRRAEPRPFAVIWLGYILAASVLSIGAVGAMGMMASEVYRPAARVMIAILGAGVAIVWPMIRLSQEPPERPYRAGLADAVVVVVPLLLMIGPQSLPWMAAWPLDVAGAMAAVLLGWALLIVGVLGWAFHSIKSSPRTSTQVRNGAMVMLMLLALAPAAIAAFAFATFSAQARLAGSDPGAAALLLVASPLTAPFELARERLWTGSTALITPDHWMVIASIWIVASMVWIGGLVATHRARAL